MKMVPIRSLALAAARVRAVPTANTMVHCSLLQSLLRAGHSGWLVSQAHELSLTYTLVVCRCACNEALLHLIGEGVAEGHATAAVPPPAEGHATAPSFFMILADGLFMTGIVCTLSAGLLWVIELRSGINLLLFGNVRKCGGQSG